MSLYQRRKGGVWWLYIVAPHGGGRFRRSTGEREKPRAQRVHDELKAELWKRRSGSLHGALETWIEGRTGPDTYRVKILKKKIKDVALDAIEPAELAKKIPATTPGTFNRYLNILRAVGVRGIKPKKTPKGRIRWLTADEWKRLRKALADHQRPMAELAISTGLRQANVFQLEWRQVDLRRRTAWVHADQAKAGEPLAIPLTGEPMRILRAQQKLTGTGKWVFVGRDGVKPPTEIKTAWRRALRDAEIEDFTWHDLRHTWATWHVMNGTPLQVLKELGGWADMRMVMRYAHLAKSFVAEYAGNAKPYQPQGHKSRHTEALSA